MIGIPFYLKKNIECAFARKAEEHKANLDIIKNKSNEFSKLEIEVIKNSWDKSTMDFIVVLMPLYITYNLRFYHTQNIHE